MTVWILFALAFSNFVIPAQAAVARQERLGPIGSGGGKGILCGEGAEEKVYLADTFDLVRSGQIRGYEDIPEGAVMRSAAAYLDELHPERAYPHPFVPGEKVTLGWMVAHANANLPIEYAHVVPDLNDDNIDPESLPKSCRKVQLANQDFGRNVVKVSESFTSRLTHFEFGMLRLHETLLNLRALPGVDTTPIRLEVASVLKDPNLQFRRLALSLYERQKHVPSLAPQSGSAQDFVNRYCTDDLVPYSILALQCRFAKWKAEREWKRADRASAIPTLLRIPESVACRPTSEFRNGLSWSPPALFKATRVAGDGRPQSLNTYQLELGGSVLRPDETSLRPILFWTGRHDRQGEIGDYGDLWIEMSWRTPEGRSLDLVLTEFQEMTREFLGSVSLFEPVPGESGGMVPERSSSFGVSCFTGNVEFGLDFDQSH